MSCVADTTRPVRYMWTSLCLTLAACTHTTDFSTGDGGEQDGSADGAIVEEDAGLSLGLNDAGRALCANGTRLCACSDGEDNDLDNEIDGLDNECTGPFDDYEGTFRVNDVREGKQCADCFFDGNPASGDDGCNLSSHCIQDGEPGNGGGMCKRAVDCKATDECRDHCLGITPNGCDCFGCCEVQYEGARVPIRLSGTCDMSLISNTQACQRCTINRSCFNECEACDLCPGRKFEDLSLACKNAVTCTTSGVKSCASAADCDSSQYCSQRCCVPILF